MWPKLAKAIRESKEYKEYKELKEDIDAVPVMKAKVEDFEKMRYEVQVEICKEAEMQLKQNKSSRNVCEMY